MGGAPLTPKTGALFSLGPRQRLQRGSSLKKAAMKTDMDRKSGRKYRDGKIPSESRTVHTWRTRPDPLAAVWAELEAELDQAPGLQANTLLALLQERHPGTYGNELLRTLQRRLKGWRAMAGPAKEVFFAQVHEPGRLGASDFTHLTSLGVTIQGQAFAHLAYHFVLPYSNWEHVTLCFRRASPASARVCKTRCGRWAACRCGTARIA